MTPVVSVINMKGGVGKTTVTGNVFREFFRSLATRTLLIDFDAQSNLTQLLLTRTMYEKCKADRRTLWHVMEPDPTVSVFETSNTDTTSIRSAEDYTRLLKYLTSNHEIDLHLLPGDFRVAKLNLREKPETLQIPRKRFQSLISKAKHKFGLVVLDCNPSSSFMTRCAIENSTHLLVPVRPDKYSVAGLEMIAEYVEGLPGLANPPAIIVIMNGTSSSLSVEESAIRGHPKFGPLVMVSSIPQTRVLAARSDYTGFAVDRGVAYSARARNLLRDVAREFATKVGIIK